MTKEEMIVSSVPIHFMGFLMNVDDSITGLQLDDGFRIERKSQAEVMPFLNSIEKSYGEHESVQLIAFDSQGSPRGCYCVTKPSVDQFEATSRGGMVIKWATAGSVHSQLQDKLRLLRLFKEGNVVMPYSCLYRNPPDGHPDIPSLARSYPVWDRTPLALELCELEEAQSFVTTHSLPLSREYLQLAFEGFELSYEVQDSRLAFLIIDDQCGSGFWTPGEYRDNTPSIEECGGPPGRRHMRIGAHLQGYEETVCNKVEDCPRRNGDKTEGPTATG